MQSQTNIAKDPHSQNIINHQENNNQETHANWEHPEEHIQIGELIKSIIYGGVDGGTNTLIVILSSFSAGVSPSKILAYCIAICVGDAIGMGLGDYLSAKSEIEFIKSEEEREYYEVENLQNCEKKEIIQIYTNKGFSLEDSQRISELYATNAKAFVNIMMLEELQLVMSDPIFAIKCGIVTFFAFLIFGALPVIPYIITSGIIKSQNHPWIASICIGAFQLFALGFMKAVIIASNKLKSGVQILIIGAVATAIGYGIGRAFPES